MAKLIKIETVYHFYAVDLTEEQVERYNSDVEDADYDVREEVEDGLKYVQEKDGGTEYYIEE